MKIGNVRLLALIYLFLTMLFFSYSYLHFLSVKGRNNWGQDGKLVCSSSFTYACRGRLFCLPHPYGCSCAAGYRGIDCNEGNYIIIIISIVIYIRVYVFGKVMSQRIHFLYHILSKILIFW